MAALATALTMVPSGMLGQVNEKSFDPFGLSISYPLVHLVHSADPGAEGTTADLLAHRPYLLYQLGRDLFNRQFTAAQGAYGRAASLDVPLYVGVPPGRAPAAPARFARDHSASCGMCHSSVYREPASGQTLASTGGEGRDTPHFYGAGLVEMIGQEVRRQVLARCDADGDGRIDRVEAASSCRALVEPAPGAPPIDFGSVGVDERGVPKLNSAFRIWFEDADGRVMPEALGLGDPGVVAYGLAFQPFGWGRGWMQTAGLRIAQGGEATTLREFVAVAADLHMGLQAYDPVQRSPGPAAGFGGLAGTSLLGVQQFGFGGSPDPGTVVDARGLSTDDPDRDGVASELTAGDLDALEHFLLHLPAPAALGGPEEERGRRVLTGIGCTRCHVESWHLPGVGEAPGAAGDRRRFALETVTVDAGRRGRALTGRLVSLARRRPDGSVEPRRGPVPVDHVYSDFKHWDLGSGFAERRFDGTLQRLHRTAPLWGVGSTAPYGHSGRHATLDDAIRAHGGAAREEALRYAALAEPDRQLLLSYLRSLVLFPTDEIPADIDGDGEIADPYEIGGCPVGTERFDPRLLLETDPYFRLLGTVVDADGRPRPLLVIVNPRRAFGLDLAWRVDLDGDGFADRLGSAAAGLGETGGH